jgi:hypothetical protein
LAIATGATVVSVVPLAEQVTVNEPEDRENPFTNASPHDWPKGRYPPGTHGIGAVRSTVMPVLRAENTVHD